MQLEKNSNRDSHMENQDIDCAKDHEQKMDTLMGGDTSRTKGLKVNASPFNEVKLELAVMICLAVLLLLGADFITLNNTHQIFIFVVFGITASGWIMFRTRRVVQQLKNDDTKQP